MTSRGRFIVSLIPEEDNVYMECTENPKNPNGNCGKESCLQVIEESHNREKLYQVCDGDELLDFKRSLRPRDRVFQYARSEEGDGDFSTDTDEYVPSKLRHHNTDSNSTTTVLQEDFKISYEDLNIPFEELNIPYGDISIIKVNSLITPSDLGVAPSQVNQYNSLIELEEFDAPIQTNSLDQQLYLLGVCNKQNLHSNEVSQEITNVLTPTECSHQSKSLSCSNKKRNYPKKQCPGRKRKRNPHKWKINVMKTLRNCGLQYTNKNGKVIKGRGLKSGCNINKPCYQKCHTKFSTDHRQNLFRQFWEIGNHDKQVEYLSKLVIKVQRKTVHLNNINSRRHCTYEYYLPVDGEKKRVCKKLFLDTFDITDMWITTLFKKINEYSEIIPSDGRGKYTNRGNSIDEEIKISIRQHINSIPVKESHYVRQRTSKLYFDESLTFPKLYSLYIEWMTENKPEHTKATTDQYRQLFYKEFNIDFFKPKKDQCLTCELQQTASILEKQAKESIYALHIANKSIVRELKENDKAAARKSKETLLTACFDLQKILSTPQSDVSIFYYKRKFQVYNFTIFDIGQSEGYCYVWNECIGKKGPNEIASFLFDFIKMKSVQGIKEFRFYSDSCGGQNRNRIVFLMYVYAAKTLGVNIIHNFFEVGHSQSEGDSMHALIDRRKKNHEIFIPQQWYTLIRCAKSTGKPYKVKEVCQNDIFDFKLLLNTVPNWEQDKDNKKVMWSKVQHVKINADFPNNIYYQYNFYSDYNNSIDLNYSRIKTRRQNKNTKSLNTIWDYSLLPTAYETLLPITESKYRDLNSLCSSGAIPEQYRSFYLSLPHSNAVSNPSDIIEN